MTRGEYDDAEMLLAADEALMRYLDGPPATRYSDLYQLHVAPTSLIALANVYKRQGRIAEMESVLEYVAVAGLAGTAEFRESHRAEDHLIEAQIHALRGNTSAACEQLTLAADLGFRLNWQLQLASNNVFADMFEESHFLAVLERFSQDNIDQQNRLPS
jgi:predicted nicotinamide N-methyase